MRISQYMSRIFFTTGMLIFGCNSTLETRPSIVTADNNAAFCQSWSSTDLPKIDYPSAPPAISATRFHPLQSLTPYVNAALFNKEQKLLDEKDGNLIVPYLQSLVDNSVLTMNNGLATLPYNTPTPQIPAPFISGMAQGGLLFVAAVAYKTTHSALALAIAKGALKSFALPFSEGGINAPSPKGGSGAWYLEYASSHLTQDKLLYVLNGFLFGLMMLEKTNDLQLGADLPELESLLANGLATINNAAVLKQFENRFEWTFYDLTKHNRAQAHYHAYQSLLLRHFGCSGNKTAGAYGAKWMQWYKAKMPYTLSRRSLNGNVLLDLFHFKGIYPHSYLRDEPPAEFVASVGNTRTTIISGILKGSSSPQGILHFQGNLETASFSNDIDTLDVFWHHVAWIGLPSRFPVFRFSNIRNMPSATLGRWWNCQSDQKASPASLSGRLAANGDIYSANFRDVSISTEWQDNPNRCFHLESPELLPSRVKVTDWRDRWKAGYRFAAITQKTDEQWKDFYITSPDELEGYRKSQGILSFKVPNYIDTRKYPLLFLPIQLGKLEALRIEFSTGDSRSGRYWPTFYNYSQSLVLSFESFPDETTGQIKTIFLRAYLPDNVRVGKIIRVGAPVFLSGVEGLLSNLDFEYQAPNQYSTQLNNTPIFNIPRLYFKKMSAK